MNGLDTCDCYPPSVSNCFRIHGTAERTTCSPEAQSIIVVHDLGMFDSWSNRRDVHVFEGDFQRVEDGSVCSVTDSVNALSKRLVSELTAIRTL